MKPQTQPPRHPRGRVREVRKQLARAPHSHHCHRHRTAIEGCARPQRPSGRRWRNRCHGCAAHPCCRARLSACYRHQSRSDWCALRCCDGVGPRHLHRQPERVKGARPPTAPCQGRPLHERSPPQWWLYHHPGAVAATAGPGSCHASLCHCCRDCAVNWTEPPRGRNLALRGAAAAGRVSGPNRRVLRQHRLLPVCPTAATREP